VRASAGERWQHQASPVEVSGAALKPDRLTSDEWVRRDRAPRGNRFSRSAGAHRRGIAGPHQRGPDAGEPGAEDVTESAPRSSTRSAFFGRRHAQIRPCSRIWAALLDVATARYRHDPPASRVHPRCGPQPRKCAARRPTTNLDLTPRRLDPVPRTSMSTAAATSPARNNQDGHSVRNREQLQPTARGWPAPTTSVCFGFSVCTGAGPRCVHLNCRAQTGRRQAGAGRPSSVWTARRTGEVGAQFPGR
jgi:hypothetical protein